MTDSTPARENDQRAAVYREGDFWIIRASSFGNCDLALARIAAGMQGAEFPQSMRDAMDFGIAHEPVVIGRLEEPDVGPTGWYALDEAEVARYGQVDDSRQMVGEITVGKVKVRVHPDGIAQNRQMRTTGDDTRVLEVKCMAEGNDPEKGMYDWQFSIEMAATKLPLLLAIGWKVPDVENATVRKLDRVEVREIDTPPYSLGEIKRRMVGLGKMFDLAVEGDWDAIGGCDQSMYPCPFYELHATDDPKFAEITNAEKVAKVEGLIARIRELKAREADGKAAGEARRIVEQELANEVGGWGFKGYAGGWKVQVTESQVEESTRVVKAHTRRVVKIEERK